MSPPSIRTHIPESSNIFPNLSPQIIFYLHARKLCRDVEDCLVGKGAQACCGVDV